MALKIGLVHQPIVGEVASGDHYCVLDCDGYFLVAVADGLGHGREAEAAAVKAIRFVEAHPERPPQVLLEGCHEALKGTRGAVLAICRIDRAAQTLTHAGLGNIETRLISAERVRRPVTVNGIVGHSARKFRAESFPFAPGDMLVMHSDGISERFELSPRSRDRDVQMLADQLARAHGKLHDDQLMLVVRDEP